MGWTWWSLGNRPAWFPVVACLVGVVLGPRAGVSWMLWAAVAVVACAIAWARGTRLGGVLAGLAAASALGAALAAGAGDGELPPLGEKLLLEGTVEKAGAHGFTLDAAAADGAPLGFRVALSGDEAPPVLEGQRVRVEAKLRLVQDAANPGEWSRAEWAWRRGQPLTGTYHPARLVVLSPPSRWQRWLRDEHAALSRATHALTADDAAAAFLLTLSAGQRAELGEALEDTFARSGLAHVLSVSGLHVAVLAFSLFGAARWLLSRRMRAPLRLTDPRVFAAPLALPLAWLYVAFTGWQAPAVRSALMCSLVLGAWVLRRRSDGLNALAVAALAMLVIDPAAPFDLSVQLSFLAVLALVVLAPTLRAAVPLPPPSPKTQAGWALRLARWREAALSTFLASLAVTLTTAPLVLSAFQRVSLAGLVSNVVTLPLSGLLTVVAAGGAALHVLWPPLAVPALGLGVGLAKLFVWTAERFAALPGAAAELPAASGWLVALWWVGLVALVFLPGRWRWVALASPVALALHLAGPRVDDGLTVTFLAVGQGDAVVLSSQGHHALIDGGGVPHGQDTGRRFVLPYLRQRHIDHLDLAVLTHAHPDHALGLTTTLEEVPAARLWLHDEPGDGPLVSDLLAAAEGAQVEEKHAQDTGFTLGAAQLEVLGPPPEAAMLDGENDHSLVLRVRHGAVTVLLTGDVEAGGEAALAPGAVTVLKAPHHGSDTSSTAEFVERTRPKHVVFCVGRDNRFGFPRDEVVRRWEAVGARCYRTDLDGAITFHSDGRDVTVDTFKPTERRARPGRR